MLSFVDRLAMPYYASANAARNRLSGGQERSAPDVNWLFPTPWYVDDLAHDEMAGIDPRRSARNDSVFTPRMQPRALGAAELIADIAQGSVASQGANARLGELAIAGSSPSMTALTAIAPASFAEPMSGGRSRDIVGLASTAQVAAKPSAPLAPATPRARAAQLLADVSRHGDHARTQPIASAPVAMPAGLGALDRAVRVEAALRAPIVSRTPIAESIAAPSRGVPVAAQQGGTDFESPSMILVNPAFRSRPRASAAPPMAPAAAAGRPRRALDAAAERLPTGLRQLAWSDRWLARFAGASAPTLSSFQLGEARSTRDLEAEPFHPVFPAAVFDGQRRPWQGDASESGSATSTGRARTARAAASDAARPATVDVGSDAARKTASRPVPADDGEVVSDETFAAIAADLAQRRPRPGSDGLHGTRRVGPITVGAKPSQLAEAALQPVAPWSGSGLAATLGSSPAMPALSAMISVGASPTFDVRALAQAPAIAPSRQAFAEAAATPGRLDALAASAPGEVFFQGERSADERQRGGKLAPVGPGDRARGKLDSRDAARNVAERSASEPTPERATDASVEAAIHTAGELSSEAQVRRSPSMGAVGQLARRFGLERTHAASDLSLDFIEPEILAAARVYGFGPNEAARANRLAHQDETNLSALSDSVAMTFVAAVAGSQGAHGSRGSELARGGQSAVAGAPTTSATAAASVTTAPVDDSARAALDATAQASGAGANDRSGDDLVAGGDTLSRAAHLLPGQFSLPVSGSSVRARGATLWPTAALNSLSIEARRAGELSPQIDFALELLAAGEVADAAAIASSPRGVSSEAAVATGSLGSGDGGPMERPGLAGAGGLSAGFAASGDAGQSSPTGLRAAFEAIYVALTRDPEARSMTPSERAARALAVARRTPSGGSLSAKTRAALAWSVLPNVVSGGLEEKLANEVAAQTAQSGQTTDRRLGFDGELTAVAGSGETLRPSTRRMHAPSAAPALVRTGPTHQALIEAAQAAVSGSRGAGAALPSAAAMATADGIPDWFAEAAKHIAAESPGSSSGMNLAQMTLVRTSPLSQIAASPRGGGGPRAQSGGGAAANQGARDGQSQSPDLEAMVDELASMLRDYFEIQRMRNGD